MTIPYLPFEIKALITQQLGIERDLDSLRALRSSCAEFCSLSRPHIYSFLDLRNRKLSSILLFTTFISPHFGHLIESVAHSPIPTSVHLISSPQQKLFHLRELDQAYSLALLNLTAVKSVDLTVPTLDYEPFYYHTLSVLLNWAKVKSLTIRSEGWGRGDFISSEDAFNSKSMGVLLKAFPNLTRFRALGISGTDLSPDGPSLKEFLSIQTLSCTQLHLAGGYLQEFTPHFTRLASQLTLTHLVIAEDSEIEWIELYDLLIAVSPHLKSYSMRQSGHITHDESTEVRPFAINQLPKLRRLVLALEGEILFALDQFANLQLSSLEVGSPNFTQGLCNRLQSSNYFPGLKELNIVSDSIEGVYEACAVRGIRVRPGYDHEGDFLM